ncbi:MAG: hypothetical protein KDD60_00440 [Bdellovibrionales bacterium]|nr:hypothetical protein [Bdellovibrionales bacterium]
MKNNSNQSWHKRMRCNLCRSFKREAGITLLYFSAIVLPILFVLFSITIDFGMYLAEEKEIQALLDKAAIHAERFLPYTEEAETAFSAFSQQYHQLQRGTLAFRYDPVVQEDDVLSIVYERRFTPFFASYFGGDISFPLRVRSDVRATPLDVMLVFDTSFYLAPDLFGANWWDDPADGEIERAASVFQQGIISVTHDSDGDGEATVVDPRIVSQQCFSPPFRLMKRSIIEIYRYLASFRDNDIGIEVYPSRIEDPLHPGTAGFSYPLRELSRSDRPNVPSALSFPVETSVFIRSEHCAAAAEREDWTSPFSLPQASDAFTGLWKPLEGAPLHMIDQTANWRFDEQYQQYLSSEQLVWSQVVRREAIAPGDTAGMIGTVAEKLLSTNSEEQRGGVQHVPLKQAIIFAGDTAWADGERLVTNDGAVNPVVEGAIEEALIRLRDSVTQSSDLHFRLYYLSFQHEGNRLAFSEGMNRLQDVFARVFSGAEADVQKRFSLQVLWSESPENFSDQIISFLALSRRTGVISR